MSHTFSSTAGNGAPSNGGLLGRLGVDRNKSGSVGKVIKRAQSPSNRRTS